MTSFMNRWSGLEILGLILLAPALALSQVKSAAQRLLDAEEKIAELESRDKKRAKELDEVKAALGARKKTDDKGFYSDGVFTLGGVKLKLGGKAELLFIDSQSERDPIVGSTSNAEPRFEINRLRLSPTLLFTKEISLSSQIDFRPAAGRTLLKELTARYRVDPAWWFRSDFRFGLDDRFIRPARRTKNYPLLGNAFWRDESIAATWMLKFGDAEGHPAKAKKRATAEQDPDSGVVLEGAEGEQIAQQGANEGGLLAERAASHDPFDLAENLGELRTYVSIGNGNSLDKNEVGFDGASFNDLVQDNRNVTEDLSIREVGLGLGYGRSFGWLGDFDAIVFYYNDELSDTSLNYLQQDLTVRNPVTGAPTAGYGDSSSRKSYKYGVGGEYFLPAAELVPADWKPRSSDGLRLGGQYIRAHDGKLIRDGWYAQVSYLHSFPDRLLFKKYFRSIEPVVRYGTLDVNLRPTPFLPGTWDRRQLLLGLNLEVVKEVVIRFEYAFNRERTGGGAATGGPSRVSNDELMIELLLQF